jgi:hypothetical protein
MDIAVSFTSGAIALDDDRGSVFYLYLLPTDYSFF